MASDYTGLADRLEKRGTPYSANNGAAPQGPLYTKNNGTEAARKINNTFDLGSYEGYVLASELEAAGATNRAEDSSGTRTVGTLG